MTVITCRRNVLRGFRQLSERRPEFASYHYIGGSSGQWRVTQMITHSGPALKAVSYMDVVNGTLEKLPWGTSWVLNGVISNTRYVTREEVEPAGKRNVRSFGGEASCAAMIAIRKSPQWWKLAQEKRREIVEEQSQHLESWLNFWPALARRLQHGRDLGDQFDFVTWFEYAPSDVVEFEEMLAVLRTTDEWTYVEREIEMRLVHK